MFEDTSYIADVSQASKQGWQTAQNISLEFRKMDNEWPRNISYIFEFEPRYIFTKMYSKDKIVECIGNGMYLPSNQKQIKSPLITSDAVSCCPVTITIININEGEINQEQTKISFRFFVFLMVFCFPVLCWWSWTSLFHFITL